MHLRPCQGWFCGRSASWIAVSVGDDEIDSVTCEHCLGMASDFGGAALHRLRQLREHLERRDGAVSAGASAAFKAAASPVSPPPTSLLAGAKPAPACRPGCEDYARCTVTVGALTVEPGIELRRGDDLEVMWVVLRSFALHVADLVRDLGWVPALEQVRLDFEHVWPGRAWFLELHDTDGRWTQSYQPYGVPRLEASGP